MNPELLKIFAVINLWLNVPPSNGNLSFVRNDTIFIQSTATASGWVVSQKVALRNKRLRVKIIKSGWDGAFSISPQVDLNSIDGMYSQPSRLRFSPYGMPRTLHAEWRRNGVYSDLNIGLAGDDPFWLAMDFVRDSVSFLRSSDGINWQRLWQEPFNLPGYSLADSFFVELQAHKTPSGGELLATQMILEDLSEPEPPPGPQPVQVKSTEVTIEWDANTELDLAGYNLYYGASSRLYDRKVNAKLFSAVTVKNLLPHTQYFFAVTSYDTAGNESAYSNEVSAITGEAQQEFSEYDLNQTGAVDVFDWLLLLRLIGYDVGHAFYNARADLTKDEMIDGFDKAKFARLSGVF